MKATELTEFDPSMFLDNEEVIHHYLAMSFQSGDPVEIQAALGTVAKARGMSALARDSGIKREALYRALSDKGNAEFATIMKVLSALGLQLTLTTGKAVPAKKVAPKKVAPKAKTSTSTRAPKPVAKRARPAAKRASPTAGATRKTATKQRTAHA